MGGFSEAAGAAGAVRCDRRRPTSSSSTTTCADGGGGESPDERNKTAWQRGLSHRVDEAVQDDGSASDQQRVGKKSREPDGCWRATTTIRREKAERAKKKDGRGRIDAGERRKSILFQINPGHTSKQADWLLGFRHGLAKLQTTPPPPAAASSFRSVGAL